MKKPNIKELEKAFDGDLDLVLFFLSWVKNSQNATKAYQEIHPNIDPASAAVMGSRLLKKVNIEYILQVYGLSIETYFTQLSEGMKAQKSDITGNTYPDHKVRDTYHTKLGQLLGLEKGGSEVVNNTQNNYFNLTDEQLDQLIESKRRKAGVAEAISGEREKNIIEPS